MKLFVVSRLHNCEKAAKSKYIHTTQQNQTDHLLWKCITFCNNLIRAKEGWLSICCNKTNEPGEDLVKGRGKGETIAKFLPPPFLLFGGSWTSYQIFKKGGIDKTSLLIGGLLGKKWWPFTEGCSFYIKNKLKSEIFNGKKSL